jgi:hypothetical protein
MFLVFVIVVSLKFQLQFRQSTNFFKDIDVQDKSGRDGFFLICVYYFIPHVFQHFNGTRSHGMR